MQANLIESEADLTNNQVLTKKSKMTGLFGSFHLDQTEITINVESIQEVVNYPEKVTTIPLSPKFLVGVFNLRGTVIPIIILKMLLGFPESEVKNNQKVAIIIFEGARIGLVFDSTGEILRVNPEQINEFSYADGALNKVIKGAIKLDEGRRIIQVLNPKELVKIENFPQIIEAQSGSNEINIKKLRSKRKQCISFCSGNGLLAFNIQAIHEIVKTPEIKQSPLSSDLCRGMINFRGRIVPVVDMSVLIGLEKNLTTKEEDQRIVILTIDNTSFGLLIDSVSSIVTYYQEDLLVIPVLNKHKSKMFHGCISKPDSQDVILLNESEILSKSEISELTKGHSTLFKSEETVSKSKTSGARKAYITFQLDHNMATPMNEIREIIEYPTDSIIQPPGLSESARGVLNLRGQMVTIIDLRSLYQMPKIDVTPKTKVLIVESVNSKIGLIVDSIDSIIHIEEDKKLTLPAMIFGGLGETFQEDMTEILELKQGDKATTAIINLNIKATVNRITS
jgi:purine-binding chemotaxis protein CheW